MYCSTFYFQHVFILRKDYDAKERRGILSRLCEIFDVEEIDKAKLLADGMCEELWGRIYFDKKC